MLERAEYEPVIQLTKRWRYIVRKKIFNQLFYAQSNYFYSYIDCLIISNFVNSMHKMSKHLDMHNNL